VIVAHVEPHTGGGIGSQMAHGTRALVFSVSHSFSKRTGGRSRGGRPASDGVGSVTVYAVTCLGVARYLRSMQSPKQYDPATPNGCQIVTLYGLYLASVAQDAGR
jgi:hypothetical protein